MKTLLILLFSISTLFSKPILENCVDPIHGSFLQNQDLKLDSICLYRVFQDGDWVFQPQSKLTMNGQSIYTYDPNGRKLIYSLKDPKILIDESKIFVQTKEGTERVYLKRPLTENEYALWYERFPNNRYCYYEYSNIGRILKIRSTDAGQTKTFAHISFKYFGTPRKNPNFEVITHEGKTISYGYNPGSRKKRSNCQFFLSTVTGLHEETIFYADCQLAARIFQSGNVKRVDFDENEKVRSIQTQKGTTHFEYLNKKTEIRLPNGQITCIEYNKNFLPTKITSGDFVEIYDWVKEEELLEKKVYREGVLRKIYDGLDRLTKEVGDQIIEYEYTNSSNLISKKTIRKGKNTLTVKYTYFDEVLQQKTITDGVDVLTYTREKPEEFSEYYNGHFVTNVPSSQVEGTDFMPLFTNPTIPDGAKVEKDFFGRVTKLTTFDEDGKINTEEKWNYNLFHLLSYTDEEKNTTYYTYNPNGSLREEVLKQVHKRYDETGHLAELYTNDGTVHYLITNNEMGKPVQIRDLIHNLQGSRTYDKKGNLLEETLLNGETLKSIYDPKGRRKELILPDDSHIYYRWGPRNLEEIRRVTKKEKYDYSHRLVQYSASGFPTKQRLAEGFGEILFDTNAKNQITAIHSRHFEQKTIEKTQLVPSLHFYTYDCDGLGRVTTFETFDKKIFYTYDIWDRRLTKKVEDLIDGAFTETEYLHFLYDDQLEIGAIDMEDYWLKQLRVCSEVPINSGDGAIAYELEGLPYIPLHDLSGNTKLLLSVSRQKIMESYDYSEEGLEKITDYYGSILENSKAKNPWRYGTYRIDDETGLSYINGAYYDPKLQGFISVKD